MEEAMLLRADAIYRWNTQKPKASLWSAKLGTLLLTDRRFIFLSTGGSDATKRLLGAAAGGQRGGYRAADRAAEESGYLDASALDNEGSLSIDLNELQIFEWVKKTFSQHFLIGFTNANGELEPSSFRFEQISTDWKEWETTIGRLKELPREADTSAGQSLSGSGDTCSVCGHSIALNETAAIVDGRSVHLRCLSETHALSPRYPAADKRQGSGARVDASDHASWMSLRAANPEVPRLEGWTLDGNLDIPGVPDAHRLETWSELRGAPDHVQYAAALVPDDGSPCEVVIGGAIDQSGFVLIYSASGTSRQAGFPAWSRKEEWIDFSRATWPTVLQRRAAPADSRSADREYLDSHPALQRFLDANEGAGPRLESWRVLDRLPVEGVAPGAFIELWIGPIAAGPISYKILAAGFRADQRIAAIAAIENMPSVHGESFLGLFVEGEPHTNLGEYDADPHDPFAFEERARRLLSPHLTESARGPGPR